MQIIIRLLIVNVLRHNLMRIFNKGETLYRQETSARHVAKQYLVIMHLMRQLNVSYYLRRKSHQHILHFRHVEKCKLRSKESGNAAQLFAGNQWEFTASFKNHSYCFCCIDRRVWIHLEQSRNQYRRLRRADCSIEEEVRMVTAMTSISMQNLLAIPTDRRYCKKLLISSW